MKAWEEWRYRTILVTAYAATAFVYLVLPIIGTFGGQLLGTYGFPHDAFYNAGILEWGYRSLWSSSRDFFEWNAGFPVRGALAATENLVGWQLFYSPLRAAGIGVVAAYNSLLLLAIVASGLGAAMFARQLGTDRQGGAAAGFVFAFVPFHLNHAGHIQTMAVAWSPFALVALDRLLASGSRRAGAALIASVVLTAASVLYFGVFLIVVLGLYVGLCWAFGRYRPTRRRVGELVVVAALGAVALAPLVLPYLRLRGSSGQFGHPSEMIMRFSLELMSVLRTPDWQAFWSWSPLAKTWNLLDSGSWTPAFPGLVATLLGVAGITRGRRDPETRVTVKILVVIAVVTFVLALGPVFKLRGNYPSRLSEWVPMPGQLWLLVPVLRWPMRIAFYTFLCGAVLAGFGLTYLLRGRPRRVQVVATAAVLLLLAIEYRPGVQYATRSVTARPPIDMSDAYPYLAAERDTGAVIEFPVADSTGYATPVLSRYTYASAAHLRRIVAIPASARLPVLDSLVKAARELPSESARERLVARGLTRVVVHRHLMPRDSADRLIGDLTRAGYAVLFQGREAVVFRLSR